jgi:cobalt-zinc-cadmium efflux system outer membrane protein
MLILALWLGLASATWAAPLAMTYRRALDEALRHAPQLLAARTRLAVADADVAIAGVVPNPSITAGTSTQAARLSTGVSLPLHVFGQRSSSIAAGRADALAVQADVTVTRFDVQAAAAHAYVALWLAERTAEAREQAAAIAGQVDAAVAERIAIGSVPRFEGLRARSERLRAQAEAEEARLLVVAAAVELGRWVGVRDAEGLRTAGEPDVPPLPKPLAALVSGTARAPAVQREEATARAAEAHAHRERALVRPTLVLEVGADIGDPTLPGTNFRALLGVEVPLLNHRVPYVQRELAVATAAHTRAELEQIQATADLSIAYRKFEAHSARFANYRDVVQPAATEAARAIREAYALGRAPLAAVLEAERAQIEASLAVLQAQATRADDWIDVERAVGAP